MKNGARKALSGVGIRHQLGYFIKMGEGVKTITTMIYKFISIAYLAVATYFLYQIYMLDILPIKYFATLVAVILLISILILPSMYSKNGNKKRKIASLLFAIALGAVFAMSAIYSEETMGALENISIIKPPEVKQYYDVVVRADDSASSINDLAGRRVSVYNAKDGLYAEAKATLENSIDVRFEYGDSARGCIDGLYEKKTRAVFIERSKYEALKGEILDLTQRTKIIHSVEISVTVQDHTSKVKVTKEPFNVFISGNDLESKRSDVNMIVTVNPKSKHILLTSIPRDYYVELPSKKSMDKLTHSGIYGVQETVGSVEKLLGIDINYYFRVNFSSVISFVDAVGGIDVESPVAFKIEPSELNKAMHVKKGMNHFNGAEALAFCRERYAFANGDFARNENQQRVMSAIISKGTQSKVILSSYTKILNTIKKNIETNMSPTEMSSLVKMQVGDMADWTVESQAITGEGGRKHCYSLDDRAYVVMRNEEAESKAYDKIHLVMVEE